ncbi:MAG: transposase, partial [Dysgonamonadaceae bacterium]|nr:transposase [Dysgonamonadaceae bacterium]
MSTQSINPAKSKYKFRDWKAYNSTLCQRGSLSVFLSPDVFKQWNLLVNKKKEVGEVTYPDSIIQCCLLLKINCRLRYRRSTGFTGSLFTLLGKPHLPVPDYTTLCRRQKYLP